MKSHHQQQSFVLDGLSTANQWKCSCGKAYFTLSSVYVHIRKKKESQTQHQLMRPEWMVKKSKGRPRKNGIKERLEQIFKKANEGQKQCYLLGDSSMQMDEQNEGDRLVNSFINEHGQNRGIRGMLNVFGWQIKKVCLLDDTIHQFWLMNMECFPIFCNYITQCWNTCNSQIVSTANLCQILQVFCKWMFQNQLTHLLPLPSNHYPKIRVVDDEQCIMKRVVDEQCIMNRVVDEQCIMKRVVDDEQISKYLN